MNKTIGIMGCGWLGLPLAKSFIKKEYTVKGTTTSKNKIESLKKEGVNAFVISLSESGITGNINDFLNDIQTLVINVPPKLRGANKENYISKMELLLSVIKKSKVKKIIFASSTAVYGNFEGDVTEATTPEPVTESGKQLLISEQLFSNETSLQTTIIRFGGLISEDRHPVTMLSKKEKIENGNMPVNLIHRNDCIRIIFEVIKNNWWQQTINAVYPHHPSKKEYYTQEASKKGLNSPDYLLNNNRKGKKVNPFFLTNVKDFEFQTSIIS
ncbi:NAD(P)H-binding protein [Cellulophaga baltica]|uniref:NAD(P)H-binding protein n=1 Tax=Cellulophaga TaxID=104264 RepID=UPI001C0699E2|nr:MULTISPECIES: NAD(P)H-binding protein [Cellulophaga]MBU2997747.1 NAD(P)H-binding protein [Cellulophaga baltica]MDO6769143.1 NAD(P)H-binding protein [Cellulophaga sp. 1_MG-2023]